MVDNTRGIVEQRIAAAELDEDVARLVRAALAGCLEEAVAGTAGPAQDWTGAPAPADTPPADAWLTRISVAGFRGIGPRSNLDLAPGPGLTLVVGRNGTGKSSFAEALELALTGENSRWDGRPAEWKEGWRNLHHEGPPAIEARFNVGGTGERGVSLRWAEGAANVEDYDREGLAELGWEDAIVDHRPFSHTAS